MILKSFRENIGWYFTGATSIGLLFLTYGYWFGIASIPVWVSMVFASLFVIGVIGLIFDQLFYDLKEDEEIFKKYGYSKFTKKQKIFYNLTLLVIVGAFYYFTRSELFAIILFPIINIALLNIVKRLNKKT